MKRIATLALIAAAALAASGCSGTSPEDQVQSVVESYYRAAGTGDPSACDHTTDKGARLKLCKEIVKTVFQNEGIGHTEGESDLEKIRRTTVKKVTVRDDQAWASLDPDGEIQLEKINGKWLVTNDPFGL